MKQKLTKEEVLHIAKLANLHLTDEEVIKFQKQLSEVVDYFRKLDKVNTENVKPVAQLAELTNVTMPDRVDETRVLKRDEALKNANSTKDGYFKVKSLFNPE